MSGRWVIATLGLALSGCLAMVPDHVLVNGYEDVHDVPSLWVHEWEVAGERAGVNFAGTPKAFKDCTGAEMVKMSPPELTRAAERFVASKTVGDYKTLLPMVRKFSSGYEEAYGVKPGMHAGELCKDKLQAS